MASLPVFFVATLGTSGCQEGDARVRSAHGLHDTATPRTSMPGPPVPGPDDPILIFNPRKGTWEEGFLRDVPTDGEFILAGHLMRLRGTIGLLQWINDIDVVKLADADAAYDPAVKHRYPEARDVVYVTGRDGYHALLAQVPPGRKVAFQGRLYETMAAAGQLLIRYTGITLNRVTKTFKSRTDTLVDLTIRYADSGNETTISGTPEHPFFIPAIDDYVAMGKLEAGTVLQTSDGSEATVVASMTHHGDFEVFNIEVEHAHNYFVSAPGSREPGVLVHNTCSKVLGRALEAAGHVRPPGSAAHHIVAGNSPGAAQARKVLQRFGIGIDDAANGVFLPATRATANPASVAVHSTLHTNEYYRTVNKMLGAATSRAEAESMLNTIRQGLLSGGL